MQYRDFQGLNQALAHPNRYEASSSAICLSCRTIEERQEFTSCSPRDGEQPDFTHGNLHSAAVTALSHKLFFPFFFFFNYFISVHQNQPWDTFVHIFHIVSDAALNLQVCKWEMGQIACTSTDQ